MTPLEIVGIALLSVAILFILSVYTDFIITKLKQKRLEKEIKNITNEIFKNIDNDMKELKRAEFFEGLEKIKKENKEEK